MLHGQIANATSISNMTSPKLLSIIVIGRNDNYMGNFKYRLMTSINFLARSLKALNKLNDVEILVTDWNSDIPLSKVLPLSPDAASICRFIYIPPNIAGQVQPAGVSFHPGLATNVALRRGPGEFLMLFDADSLMSRYSLQALLGLLDGDLTVPYDCKRTYFFCGRYQIPWEIVQRQPTLEAWERYLTLNSGQLPLDGRSYGLGVFGIGLTMHRSLWNECRGYREDLPGWGWLDAELILRVTQRYPWVDLASIGVAIFHMEHDSRRRRTTSGHGLNPYLVSSTIAVNDENWGLGNYTFEFQQGENVLAETSAGMTGGYILTQNEKRSDILAQLTDPTVHQHLKKHLTSSKIPATEWGSLYALAWYSLYCYPRNYLEFGIRDPYAAVIVVSVCPGVEIYGLDSWQKDGRRPAPPPSFITSILSSFDYRGYMRFVSGDLETAFQRLHDSYVGNLTFDLVLVRGDLFGPNVFQQLCNVAPYLAPGGALIFTCTSPELFETTWNEMQIKFPQFVYWQCRARHTGLALAISLSEGEPKQPLPAEEIRLATAWKKIVFSRAQLLIWQKRFQSIWEQLTSQSPRNWPNILHLRWTQFRERWKVS